MQFPFFMSKVMQIDKNQVAIIDGNKKPIQTSEKPPQFSNKKPQIVENLDVVIDKMGEASSIAQGLKSTITSSQKLYGTDQKLYLKIEGRSCLGLIKIGFKSLFHRDLNGKINEIKPLCVLDFYVHESLQRKGLGKWLFEYMLSDNNTEAHQLGYDKPSFLLMNFLKKYYNLTAFIPQSHNFVVFNQYWTEPKNNLKQNQKEQQQKGQVQKGQQQQKVQQQTQRSQNSENQSQPPDPALMAEESIYPPDYQEIQNQPGYRRTQLSEIIQKAPGVFGFKSEKDQPKPIQKPPKNSAIPKGQNLLKQKEASRSVAPKAGAAQQKTIQKNIPPLKSNQQQVKKETLRPNSSQKQQVKKTQQQIPIPRKDVQPPWGTYDNETTQQFYQTTAQQMSDNRKQQR